MVQYSFTSTETEGSLGRTAQDGHLDSHTAPELCVAEEKVAALPYRLFGRHAGPSASAWVCEIRTAFINKAIRFACDCGHRLVTLSLTI